jgi:hypothetical protein
MVKLRQLFLVHTFIFIVSTTLMPILAFSFQPLTYQILSYKKKLLKDSNNFLKMGHAAAMQHVNIKKSVKCY